MKFENTIIEKKEEESKNKIILNEEHFKNSDESYNTFGKFKKEFPDLDIKLATYYRYLKKFKNNEDSGTFEIIKAKPKIKFEDIECKNPFDYIPDKFKDNPNVVIFNKEIYNLSNKEFAKKFNFSESMVTHLKNFYRNNGYAWFFMRETDKQKRTTCLYTEEKRKNEYEKRYKNWYRNKFSDKMDEINKILLSNKEDDFLRYSAPREDMIEIRLEDFFEDSATPASLKAKYPNVGEQNLNKKLSKMIENGFVNTFVHKDGKNKQSAQTRRINFYKKGDKKDFPEWYLETDLKRDIKIGRKLAIRENPILAQVLERYDDDFESEARKRLFELAGDESFESCYYREAIVKNIARHFLRKIEIGSKEISIETKNNDKEFSKMDEISAKANRYNTMDIVIHDDIIEEIKDNIEPNNYENLDVCIEDIRFVDEYLRYDYSSEAEDEKDKEKWKQEFKEDLERFKAICKRNKINLNNFI